MEDKRVEKLKSYLAEIEKSVDNKVAAKLELELCVSIIERLDSLSADCEECKQVFHDLEDHLTQLKDNIDQIDPTDIKQHHQKISTIRSHLQNKHKLVTSGYYLSIFISIGTSVGLLFGLLIYDNVALGLPIGLGIGVAIGASLDADVKKKGLTL